MRLSVDSPATASAGFNLAEVIVVLAILGVLLTIGVPQLLHLSGGLRVRLAAAEVAGVLRLARTYAIRNGSNVAVKFFTDDDWQVTFGLYRDGDGDGVRNDDLRDGTDPLVTRPRPLAHLGRNVRFGIPREEAPTDPGDARRQLLRLDDPIRFNRSDLASFSPLGASTPGSVYITDGSTHLAVVRVYNRTGKVKVLRWNRERRRWR